MKKNKILIILTICLGISTICLGIYNRYVQDENINITNDIEAFKTLYEGYNGQEVSGNKVLDVDLNDESVIYIKDSVEILEIMNQENALIYFGFSTCPWCRNMITAFTNVAVDKNQEIYYVDISEIRNAYSVVDGEVIETTVGDDSYYKLLEFLGDSLSEYTIYDDKGNSYETNTKRLFAPTVITVKSGELLDIKIGSLDAVSDPYIELTDEEYEELYLEYADIINNLQIDACTIDKC